MPDSPPIRGRFIRHRYLWLFVLLLWFFVVASLTSQVRGTGSAVPLAVFELCLFVVVIGGISVSISPGRAGKLAALSLGLPTVLLWIASHFIASVVVELARSAFAAGFLSCAIYRMLFEVFAARRVDGNILCASLCAYLLLAVVWALGYSMVSVVDGAAFIHTVGTATPIVLRVGPVTSGDALYFSIATLTTLGYGDIVPTAPVARALACVEAVVGQLYLAVLVARLVGLHIVHEMSAESRAAQSK